MDEKTVRIVQESFAKVFLRQQDMGQLFYRDLFASAPEIRPLFKGNMEHQGMRFMSTLSMVVNSLDDLVTVMPIAAALARRHVEFGVLPEHYDAVGASLLRTLEWSLAHEFTPEVRAAWETAYAAMAAAMVEVAYGEDDDTS